MLAGFVRPVFREFVVFFLTTNASCIMMRQERLQQAFHAGELRQLSMKPW